MDNKSCIRICIFRYFSLPTSSNIETGRLAISKTKYCYPELLCDRRCNNQQNDVPSNSNNSNIKAVWDESRTVATKSTNKKITRLSMQIMLLFCRFNAPHLIMYFSVIASIVLYTNSSANF